MITKTEVREVSIFRKSATVIRTGSVKLEAGRNLVYIAGMTKTADAGSFRLKFPPTVKAVNMQIVNPQETDLGEEKESEKIRERIAELAYRINTCNYLDELWKTNGNFSVRSNISIEEQEAYIRKLPDELSRNHEEVKELTKAQDMLAKELEVMEKEEEKPLVMAELVSEKAEVIPFILQYQENAAGWSPKYEVRFSGTDEPLAVSMKARINQTSKEDWKEVKVTLFTGNPVSSEEIPELKSLQLSFYEPSEKTAARGAMPPQFMGMMQMQAASASAMSAPGAMNPMMSMDAMKMMSALQTEEAAVLEEESMTAFELPTLRDILSDTSGNLADLKNFSVEAKYHVLCIPRLSDKCFMTAQIVSADWPLPPARAAVYLKDTLAGEFYVDSNSEPDTFNLSLGNDERITVSRTELPKKTQEALLKNQKKTLYAYRINLVNNSSETVDVKILDQIPVSTEKTIVVETSVLSDASLNEETGELSWEMSAESKKEIVLNVSYSVAWPKDKRLSEQRTTITAKKTKTCKTCGWSGETGKFCPECGSVI
ncbi:MAG: DUF4139 domain-containing protein [Lachnospiraceae bacterium]|nr:DUF4139 domain-containing protein [Lachnospiraceae bacterium]